MVTFVFTLSFINSLSCDVLSLTSPRPSRNLEIVSMLNQCTEFPLNNWLSLCLVYTVITNLSA